MPLHALEDLDDALDLTRDFLTPVDRTTWVKLALVAFFIGGPGANVNTVQYSFGGGGDTDMGQPTDVPPFDLGNEWWLAVAAIVGVILVLALAFALVGSVMEFVFVESLRSREVTVRRYWNRRWRQGLRLFGFRLVVGLLVFGSVLLVGLAGFFFFDDLSAQAVLGVVLVLVPTFVVMAVVVGLVYGFTTVFVVPVMVLEDCGVLAGWRRLWPTLVGQWEQYLAYVVASFFLSIVGGILVGIVTAILAVVLLIPFAILFGVVAGVFTLLVETVELALLVGGVVAGVPFLLSVVVVVALVQVPVQTYLRYYALLVLGDVDSDLDLVPDQRAALREPSGEAST